MGEEEMPAALAPAVANGLETGRKAQWPLTPEDEKFLGHIHDLLLQGEVSEAFSELFPTLRARRSSATAEEWQGLMLACRSHPLRALIHQDPFTRHAYERPRGYPGDAPLLDFIYAVDEGWPLPAGTTLLGEAIFQITIRTEACEGVRARREFIAHLLDEASSECRPHVLSVAAGHLREASLSSAVRRRRLGRFVALDADGESLAEVQRCYGRWGVEVVQSSARRLLRPGTIGRFDIIYSTGLFDYLAQGTARKLAAALFEALAPRGRLIIANFLPGLPGTGYMEAFMRWELIYRTRLELLDVFSLIPQEKTRDIRIFAEENQNILFVQVTRA
jgi:SAM-dependent methyltransferase